jgi:hypothetical protein
MYMGENLQNGEYIELDSAKDIIISALANYHPDLAIMAAEILHNEEQMNIAEIPMEQDLRVMQVRAAGLTIERVEEKGLLMKDFSKTYGPHFTRQDNPEGSKAIVDFEYNGTPKAVLYLAHELGHAIADKVQLETGADRNFSSNEAERQAYFIQSIFTHYTGQESSESAYDHTKPDSEQDISQERADQYIESKNKLDHALFMNLDQRKDLMIKALGAKTEALELKSKSGPAREITLSL